MPAPTPSLADIVTHTPFWVWGVLLLVLFLGLQRTQDRTVSLPRLLFFPVVLGLYAMSGLASATIEMLPAVIVGAVAGGVGGWLLEPQGATRRLPDGRIFVRGEWISLIQVLVIFGVRYTTGVIAATAPALAVDPSYRMVTLSVTAALTGLLLGRTVARLRAYANTPSPAV